MHNWSDQPCSQCDLLAKMAKTLFSLSFFFHAVVIHLIRGGIIIGSYWEIRSWTCWPDSFFPPVYGCTKQEWPDTKTRGAMHTCGSQHTHTVARDGWGRLKGILLFLHSETFPDSKVAHLVSSTFFFLYLTTVRWMTCITL